MRRSLSAAQSLIVLSISALLSGQDSVLGGRASPPTAPRLTVGEAVRRALSRNPDLLNAADSVRSAIVNESAVRSTFLPQVTPFFSRARADESGTLSQSYGFTFSEQLPFGPLLEGHARLDRFPNAVPAVAYGSDYRLTLTQPLLGGADPAVTREPLREARRTTQSQERSFEITRRGTVLLVYRLYLGLAEQEDVVRLQKERAGRAKELTAFSRGRFAAGTVSKLDVYRAEQQEAAAQVALADAENLLEDLQDSLRRAVDLPTDFPVVVDRLTELPRSELPLEEAVNGVAGRRPEAAEAGDQVRDSEFAVRIARSFELPSVQGVVGYQSVGSGSSSGDALHPRNPTFLWGLSTQYGLNSAVLRARRRAAEIDLGVRQRNLALLLEDLVREVRHAYRRLETLQKDHETAAQNERVAELQAEVARLRFQKGLSDNFNVVDAENLLNSARLLEVDSRIQILLARLDCLYASGDFDLKPFLEQP
jgi:outer membrane protein